MRYSVNYMKNEFGKMVKKVAIIDGPELKKDESNLLEVEKQIDEIMYKEYGRNIKVISMREL